MKSKIKALVLTGLAMGICSGLVNPRKLEGEFSNPWEPEPEIHPPDTDSPEYQAYMESCRQRGLRDMDAQMRGQEFYQLYH